MARRQAPHGRSRALPEGSDTPGVATGRTAETTIRPLPPSRSRALASCAQHSAVRPSGHRSIAPCDVYILPFTTQVNHRSAPPVPNLTLKPEVTFCVQGVLSPLLANIYLHYVYDLWTQRWRRRHAQGAMIVVRY